MPDQFNRDGNGDAYSLESILSEYKGRAFVQGKSKLSKEELAEQAQHIIDEYTKSMSEETDADPESKGRAPALSEVTEDGAEEREKEEAPDKEYAPVPGPTKEEAPPEGEESAETPFVPDKRGLFRHTREGKNAGQTKEKKLRQRAAPGEDGLVSEWLRAYSQAEDEQEDVRIYEPAFLKKRRESHQSAGTAAGQTEEAMPITRGGDSAPESVSADEAASAVEKPIEVEESAEEPEAVLPEEESAEETASPAESTDGAEDSETALANEEGEPFAERVPEEIVSEEEQPLESESAPKEPPAKESKKKNASRLRMPATPAELLGQKAASEASTERVKPEKPRRGELRRKHAETPRETVSKRMIEKGLRQVEKRLERMAQVEEKEERLFAYRQMSEDEKEFYGVGQFSPEADEEFAAEEERRAKEKQERRRAREQARRRAAEARAARDDAAEAQRRELSAAEAVRVYGSGTNALRARLMPMAGLCVLMIVLTMIPELGFSLPGVLGGTPLRLGLLFICLGLVVFLGLDVFVAGLTRPIHGHFCQETLVAVAVLLALLDTALQWLSADRIYGTPFCAAAGTSLFFASLGNLQGRRAFNLTFRVADRAKVPTVLSTEWEKVDEGHVISKNVGAVRGFVTRGTDQDLAENLYARLAPILLLLGLLLSLLCSAACGEGNAFFHILSAFMTVCAAFDLLLIFNRPFLNTAGELYNHGAALAGWNGALDMDKAVGMVLRDGDLFPANSLRLSGLKIFSHFPEERIVSYTGSLIVASGIGTTNVFSELMREYACDLYRVEELECYESGGIGANINGSQVLVGSAAFMNLMGIRLPPNLELRSAVFSAIDNELAGVFIISYTPSDAVQAALVDMLQARIRPIFALRDFLLTPSLLSGKFKITLDEGEFLTYASRFELSENNADPAEEPTAIMSREGIGHYVETVRGGRRLCRSARVALALTLLGTGLGLALLLLIFLQGAFGAASAGNVLLFMLLWELAVWIFSGF